MTLQPLTPVNCEGFLQPGCSLFQLDGEVLLFGQKGWPKRFCPTGVFSVRFRNNELRLRPITFSNDSIYLPPLRCPAVCRLDPHDGLPESYLVHGGRTPNNELSSALYVLTTESRGCNRKLTLRCNEKVLVGETPGSRYGHTLSVVQSNGKTAYVLFGGRSYMSDKERTTESWNSVVDCPPQVYVFDLEFGSTSAHTLPELGDGQAFHLALAREDCVYLLGGHSLNSDSRPPRLFRLRVELLQGRPLLACEALASGLSISSAMFTRVSQAHEYIILGGYESDSEKRFECTSVKLDEKGIHIQTMESPKWTPDVLHSRTWYGGSAGEVNFLLAVPNEGRPATETNSYYLVKFEIEGAAEDDAQECSQDLTDNSTPLEDSEELYFGREPHELMDSGDEGEGTYNREDEEDESKTGYWIRCCLGCKVDQNTWEPLYSTELSCPAMILCSSGDSGHWVHAQCMDLSETSLFQLSWDKKKYFCLDHRSPPQQEMTPPRVAMPLKRTPIKLKHRKASIAQKITQKAKKSIFKRLFN